jgi:hypothetical protein
MERFRRKERDRQKRNGEREQGQAKASAAQAREINCHLAKLRLPGTAKGARERFQV